MLNHFNLSTPKNSETKISVILTERELEIIKLVTSGQCNREIADNLFISDHTVKTHRKNINKKLHISNPVELTLFARKEGLLPD